MKKISTAVISVLATAWTASWSLADDGSPTRAQQLVAAVAVFLTSEPGKEFIGFGRDAVKETKKVVWPARREAIQMTAYVFGFVVIMALSLWLTD